MNFSPTTLYVGDLQHEVTESMLMDVFSLAGDIHSVSVCRDWNTGTSLGYAYVNFYQQEDAERALATLDSELLMGQPMRVRWSQKVSSMKKSSTGSLFIKKLDMETIDSMALYDLFLNFGRILSCKVVAYKTGTKGYGCVQFESQEAANLAKEKLDGKFFNDNKVFIEHFKPFEARQAETNGRLQKETVDLFVTNLDRNIDDECLRVEFSKFGTVTNAKIITNNGRSKGFGFVRFSSFEEAMQAKSELNGQMLGQKQMFVDVAHQKEKRRRTKAKKQVK
ncbi:polyadenylate-binding protein 1-like [Silurus meridionalis]|uniref:polyadenylate-binding protein 1-like n=1 Tax=Silurus meridionalis TaxID=175797 RepID=UPI001EEC4757|nr:polyadenylate-binding protein 1-like [Silurus meridionalis]XP_046724124.1 polyadenylate-binding protein 1-like [Silurus meridionalis]